MVQRGKVKKPLNIAKILIFEQNNKNNSVKYFSDV